MTRYLAAVACALLVLPTTLRAQESDDEWQANCREGWGDWGQRARHCEIRESGMKATGRALTVDPGMNGGVEIIGWGKSDRKSTRLNSSHPVNSYAVFCF